MTKQLSGNAVVTPSADPGPRPELCWIDKKLIDVDKRYQREVSSRGVKHINGILRDFQWRYFQVITVTPSKAGRFFAIDGQHRWLAAMRHPKVTDVPCLVQLPLDLREAAKVFDVMNTKRLGITALAKHHAAVAAGDPVAMRIAYICDEAGVAVLKSIPQGGAVPPLSLTSTNTIAKFFKHSDPLIIAALTAMAKAWPERANGFRAANIAAVIRASINLGADFDVVKMTAMLRGWNDHQEFLRAYTERTERGGVLEQILAKRIVDRYRAAGAKAAA